jgi:hypothetical protein
LALRGRVRPRARRFDRRSKAVTGACRRRTPCARLLRPYA